MSKKQSRISEKIREIISQYLVENLPTSYGVVSITRVELIGDGSRGKVYFSVLPEENENKVKEFLEQNRREIKERIRKLRIKIIPELEFEPDKELKIMEKMWGGDV